MGLKTRRRMGALVWTIGLAVAVGWGAMGYESRTTVRGIGYAAESFVAAEESGRLISVDVGLHDAVVAGAVVAKMDDTLLLLEREVRAAEFLAEADAGQQDTKATMDAARKRSQTLQTRAELAAVESQLDRLKKLQEDGAASLSEVQNVERRRERLLTRLVGRQGDPAQDGTASAWRVVAALKRLESVDARVEMLSVRSGIGGQVAEVLHHSGDIVRRGDPIVRVTPAETTEIVAWVPLTAVPKEGADTEIVRVDGTTLVASVVSVGAGPTPVPASALIDPRRPEWGVAVRLKISEGSVRPDEPVMVRL